MITSTLTFVRIPKKKSCDDGRKYTDNYNEKGTLNQPPQRLIINLLFLHLQLLRQPLHPSLRVHLQLQGALRLAPGHSLGT